MYETTGSLGQELGGDELNLTLPGLTGGASSSTAPGAESGLNWRNPTTIILIGAFVIVALTMYFNRKR